MNLKRVLVSVVLFSALGLSSGWAQGMRARAPEQFQRNPVENEAIASSSQQPVTTSPSTTNMPEYVLGVGDKLKLTVYGEEDLSGSYEVDSTGIVALPLIGNVQAAKHTIREFEKAVRDKLAEGYLHDPRVSVQVANYRPFFILGEVSKPGSYPFVNGMNVLNAVALAGGYTYRADKSDIVIVHASDPSKKEEAVNEDSAVMPGDIIRVPERFF